MAELSLPQGYQPITPYLILDNAGDFFNFVSTAFGAEYLYEPTIQDGQVGHGHIAINGGQIMYSGSKHGYPAQPAGLFIYVKNCDETYQKALDAGATTIDKPADQNYGRSCGVKDAFGNSW